MVIIEYMGNRNNTTCSTRILSNLRYYWHTRSWLFNLCRTVRNYTFLQVILPFIKMLIWLRHYFAGHDTKAWARSCTLKLAEKPLLMYFLFFCFSISTNIFIIVSSSQSASSSSVHSPRKFHRHWGSQGVTGWWFITNSWRKLLGVESEGLATGNSCGSIWRVTMTGMQSSSVIYFFAGW